MTPRAKDDWSMDHAKVVAEKAVIERLHEIERYLNKHSPNFRRGTFALVTARAGEQHNAAMAEVRTKVMGDGHHKGFFGELLDVSDLTKFYDVCAKHGSMSDKSDVGIIMHRLVETAIGALERHEHDHNAARKAARHSGPALHR